MNEETPESASASAPSTRRPTSKEPAEDSQLSTAGIMTGSMLMFIGFLNVLLSISGGFEITVFPLILYFAGMAIWANAAIEQPTPRYIVMAVAIVLGLAFFHYGEIHFWHKQVVFWFTIVIVMFFMFKDSKPVT